jgi:hypothetical protein
MSIRSLTTLEAARYVHRPKKSDTAEALPGVGKNADKANDKPSLPETLAKTLPAGLVTAYTAYTAAIVANIKPKTIRNPNPDEFLPWRWGGFVVLVIAASVLTIGSWYSKRSEPMPPLPWFSVTAITVAAAGWGLGVPESPLIGSLHGDNVWLVPLVVAALALVINLVLSSFVREPAKKTETVRA